MKQKNLTNHSHRSLRREILIVALCSIIFAFVFMFAFILYLDWSTKPEMVRIHGYPPKHRFDKDTFTYALEDAYLLKEYPTFDLTETDEYMLNLIIQGCFKDRILQNEFCLHYPSPDTMRIFGRPCSYMSITIDNFALSYVTEVTDTTFVITQYLYVKLDEEEESEENQSLQ